MEHHEPFKLDEAIALLERTPASLSMLLAGLPEQWLHASEGAGSWSPHDVLRHLINGELTNWLPRARHILAGEQRPFPPFDRAVAASEEPSPSAEDLLAQFAELRRKSIAALRQLGLVQEDLRRTGLHPELGEVTLGHLLATWAVHDLNHIGQIAQTMARRYTHDVGPWKKFLLILQSEEWREG